MADDDILNFTLPQNIPGVLFGEIVKVLETHYKPGTIVTSNNARIRAQRASVNVLEQMIAFYEAVEEGDDRELL